MGLTAQGHLQELPVLPDATMSMGRSAGGQFGSGFNLKKFHANAVSRKSLYFSLKFLIGSLRENIHRYVRFCTFTANKNWQSGFLVWVQMSLDIGKHCDGKALE